MEQDQDDNTEKIHMGPRGPETQRTSLTMCKPRKPTSHINSSTLLLEKAQQRNVL
jgi:hypothetical protein